MKQPDRTSHKRWWRLALSFLIIGHLWAVIGRPIEFATQGPTGPSPAGSLLYAPIRGYSELAYLNHGYAFFAPNPGPSHLIRAQVSRPEGDTETYLYPDLQRQWPRLLYHRHFMLTEFFHNTYQPSRMPPEVADDESLAQRWANDRRRHEAIRDSIRQHLRKAHQTDQLTIHRVEHQLVGLPEFLYDQLRLDDPRLYIHLPDDAPDPGGQLRSEPLEPPLLPRFGAPTPSVSPGVRGEGDTRPDATGPPRGNFPGSGR